MNPYERLFGKPETFALRVALFADPDEEQGFSHWAGGAPRPLWGSFELWVRGFCLTQSRREDGTKDGTISPGIEWYIEPMLRWWEDFAERCLNEEPFPLVPSRDNISSAADWYAACEVTALAEAEEEAWFIARSEWANAHKLREAFDGAACPGVFLRRLGDLVEISWDNKAWPSTRSDLRFIESQGIAFAPALEVGEVIRELLQDLGQRARQGHPGAPSAYALPTLSADAWRWLLPRQTRKALQAVQHASQIMARLQEHTTRARWPVVPHLPETRLLCELTSLKATEVRDVLALLEAGGGLDEVPLVTKLRRPAEPSPAEPWHHGYAEALRVREQLGWDEQPAPDLERWLEGVGCTISNKILPATVHGATTVSAQGGILLYANQTSRDVQRWTRQMILAAGLGMVIMDAAPGIPYAALQTPWTHWPTLARARAFGAMLLMPEAAIADAIKAAGAVTKQAVRSIMDTFGTGITATTWHLKNLGWISEDQRLSLREDLAA